ncbi:KDO2-lipid IV(A) lauroyltransferase [Frankineae bacterium MT45]|nr:KDO2-lipid IV(A) lauroyltransferase [Frankineae bacterium MT45]
MSGPTQATRAGIERLLTATAEHGADLGYAAGWAGVKALPAPVARRLFELAADAGTRRGGSGVAQLRANLARVVGPDTSREELDSLVAAAMRSYARYWLETFRLPKMSRPDVLARATTEGTEHLDAAIAAGKGVVLALPHSGNWDVAALWLIERGHPFTTVAERLKPESLYDRFVAYRESIGMRVLPLTGGERNPIEVLSERLREGGVVCLLGDRDLSRRGVEVTFFGEATRMPAGPALLATSTGAALLPVTLWYTDDGWGQRIFAPLELVEGDRVDQIRAATQQLADRFAESIAAHPADWHMLQKLWLSDLTPRSVRT